MPKLHFILTCDGGNGHKAAAEALKAKAIHDGDQYEIINTTQSGWFSGGGPDLSPAWDKYFYKGVVDFAPPIIRGWDWAQRTSNIEILRAVSSLRVFSFLSLPSFRYRTYDWLEKRADIDDFDEIIFHNTQPVCVTAITFSIAQYNRMVKENNKQSNTLPKKLVKLFNHFTDMPTPQARMFIDEMAAIHVSDLDDAQFELHTRPPLLSQLELMSYDPGANADDLIDIYHRRLRTIYPVFYQNSSQPRSSYVKFVNGPIREEFIHRKDFSAVKRDGLSIQFANEQEHAVLQSLFKTDLGSYDANTKRAKLDLNENTKITSLMLGSQASVDGTLSLVDEEIRLAHQNTSTDNKYLFVFCGANDPKKGLVLYNQVLAKAQEVNQNDQLGLKIIPLTNQPASLIADLYSLADNIIARPGGISIMEIEAVAKKATIFIFSELAKLKKFSNWLLRKKRAELNTYFSQQPHEKRLADLIAWESGNALHAENVCRDANGRTRVVPINKYTYGHECLLLRQKESITTLIEQGNYQEAFAQMQQNEATVSEYFLTGTDVGTDLACILEVKRFNLAIIQQLQALLDHYPRLKSLRNGPVHTLSLIQEANEQIDEDIQLNITPAEILKNIGIKMELLKSSFSLSIEVVKNSKLKNKLEIVEVLTQIANGVVAVFTWLFGIKSNNVTVNSLERLQEDFVKTLPTVVLRRMSHYVVVVDNEHVTDLEKSEWDIAEKILTMTPGLKQKTCILFQSEYPELKHDFLYCYDDEEKSSKLFAMGRKLGKGGNGDVVLLQAKDGDNAVMKKGAEPRELDCLKRVHRYLGNYQLNAKYFNIQKYIPGIVFADYMIESKKGLFVTYKAFSNTEKLQIALAVANGLKACRDKGIAVHGDISSQNIMIQKDANSNIQATFIDYGCSQLESNPTLTYRPYISPYYGAPELLKAVQKYTVNTARPFPYTEKSDIYSLGVMFRDLGVDKHLVAQMTAIVPDERIDLNTLISFLSQQLDPSKEDTAEFNMKLHGF
ncbi:MAG: hypothetical protein CK426_08670 [Legionella sp.]|nr:MAG: hypothetical protein CK423_07325 [Legionella sp.]PJD97135.1 MAG: hypothetical protein CK426_08670 [Legionella sp.]